MKTVTLSTRVTQSEAKELDKLASTTGLDRSSFIKQLLRQGLEEFKFTMAIRLYREKKISLSKASEISGLSINDIISRIPDQRVELNYDVEELARDLK